jgi:co-chaperonin GroES (HSP10)
MDLTPFRGSCFVKPIETAETIPGGKILLPEAYRQRLTAQQAEIVAVGPPSPCDKPEDCERVHPHPVDRRLQPGAWVLCAKWAYVGVREKLFAVRHEDILGVFIE